MLQLDQKVFNLELTFVQQSLSPLQLTLRGECNYYDDGCGVDRGNVSLDEL